MVEARSRAENEIEPADTDAHRKSFEFCHRGTENTELDSSLYLCVSVADLKAMDTIKISDLEVFYRVGVPDDERAKPQRLLLTIEMALDVSAAASSDDLRKTIDYAAIADFLLKFGEGRSWKLIEKLAANIADDLLARFKPQGVTVEVRKFVIPRAQFVSVTLTRKR